MSANTPNFPLLREAAAIIDGIPSSVLKLNSIQQQTGESLSCGTVCCAIGWLGHHPKFQKLGLETDAEMDELKFHGRQTYYAEAASRIFGITEREADNLFAPRNCGNDLDPAGSFHMTDKALFMNRVRKLLVKYGRRVQVQPRP